MALEEFKKEVGIDNKLKKIEQDLLKLDEEDLKHIKNLKEKIMKPQVTSPSVVKKKLTRSKTI